MLILAENIHIFPQAGEILAVKISGGKEIDRFEMFS
jgi:hypothetical protein